MTPGMRIHRILRRGIGGWMIQQSDCRCSTSMRVRRLAMDEHLSPELGGNLGGEIGLLLLDALAERKAREGGDLDRRAGLLLCRLDDFGDAGLAVDDED